MAATALKTKVFSKKEYLALEEKSEVRHEFHNGKIIEMPGGTINHSRITAQIISALIVATEKKDKEYIVFSPDMKILIPNENSILYADALVVCEKIEYLAGRKDVILNPVLIVEVLSPSTENFDRNGKFMLYKQLPSLKEYVLVKQERPHINSFFNEKQGVWLDTVEEDLNKTIYLASIDVTLSLKQIYKGIF